MQPKDKKTPKKLQLNLETLKHVAAGGGARDWSGGGCTVLTTCSPECT